MNNPPKLNAPLNPHVWRKFDQAQRNMIHQFKQSVRRSRRRKQFHRCKKWALIMGGVADKLMLLSLLVFLGCSYTCHGQTDAQIADAIYRIEGGPRARVPYGILSVKVRTCAEARRVCLTTIRNNRMRWQNAGRPGLFLEFLADRYCPPSVDAVGNRNWKRNIKTLLK